jgi:anti-sigma factor RsiW
MEDHGLNRDLRQALRELPCERAREGFTARVLARLDRDVQRAAWKRPRLVFAAAALLAVMASAGVIQYRTDQRQEEARRVLRELRSEHDSLKHEFESLSAPPVVYVGGNEQVDLVVDLSRVQGASF